MDEIIKPLLTTSILSKKHVRKLITTLSTNPYFVRAYFSDSQLGLLFFDSSKEEYRCYSNKVANELFETINRTYKEKVSFIPHVFLLSPHAQLPQLSYDEVTYTTLARRYSMTLLRFRTHQHLSYYIEDMVHFICENHPMFAHVKIPASRHKSVFRHLKKAVKPQDVLIAADSKDKVLGVAICHNQRVVHILTINQASYEGILPFLLMASSKDS